MSEMTSRNSGQVRAVASGRTIGAIAGLGPALVIVGYYLATGGKIQAGIGVIGVVAIVAGWIVGPIATGPLRSDVVAMAAYFLVGYLLNLAVGTVAAIGREEPALTMAQTLLGGLFYLPVWAVFLTPVALLWIGIVRFLRRVGSTTRPS